MTPARNIGKPQGAMELLNCRRLPGRVNAMEAAILLGFQEHDITALIAAKLLTPLGKPSPNSTKYFASVDVIEAAQDRSWLSQATRTVSRHWSEKNSRKKAASPAPECVAA